MAVWGDFDGLKVMDGFFSGSLVTVFDPVTSACSKGHGRFSNSYTAAASDCRQPRLHLVRPGAWLCTLLHLPPWPVKPCPLHRHQRRPRRLHPGPDGRPHGRSPDLQLQPLRPRERDHAPSADAGGGSAALVRLRRSRVPLAQRAFEDAHGQVRGAGQAEEVRDVLASPGGRPVELCHRGQEGTCEPVEEGPRLQAAGEWPWRSRRSRERPHCPLLPEA
mmetsp:Transcript_18633/g.37360  ORF Transcript_18633/g.37360 Transcript_18633/m.37360 type:complete len:219 (-) Transcript_18633:1356-2012(-)